MFYIWILTCYLTIVFIYNNKINWSWLGCPVTEVAAGFVAMDLQGLADVACFVLSPSPLKKKQSTQIYLFLYY